jgi:hypothetical protein
MNNRSLGPRSSSSAGSAIVCVESGCVTLQSLVLSISIMC